jgi:hypothetical protein
VVWCGVVWCGVVWCGVVRQSKQCAAMKARVSGYTPHRSQPVLHALCLLRVHCAGSYHGLAPTNKRSGSYGILHYTTDKSGKVTDMTIWRAGFQEEREVLVSTNSAADSCACADQS